MGVDEKIDSTTFLESLLILWFLLMKSNLVVPTGIEPVTLGLWVLRSNQLSYGTTFWRKGQDSNLRSVNLPVFKTGAINHSATLPLTIIPEIFFPVKWKIILGKLARKPNKKWKISLSKPIRNNKKDLLNSIKNSAKTPARSNLLRFPQKGAREGSF